MEQRYYAALVHMSEIGMHDPQPKSFRQIQKLT